LHPVAHQYRFVGTRHRLMQLYGARGRSFSRTLSLRCRRRLARLAGTRRHMAHTANILIVQIHRMHDELARALSAADGPQHVGFDEPDEAPGSGELEHALEAVGLHVLEIQAIRLDHGFDAAYAGVLLQVAEGVEKE